LLQLKALNPMLRHQLRPLLHRLPLRPGLKTQLRLSVSA
jgi:hypothetical protein